MQGRARRDVLKKNLCRPLPRGRIELLILTSEGRRTDAEGNPKARSGSAHPMVPLSSVCRPLTSDLRPLSLSAFQNSPVSSHTRCFLDLIVTPNERMIQTRKKPGRARAKALPTGTLEQIVAEFSNPQPCMLMPG